MFELWTVKTANGQKATVMLELLSLQYRTRVIDLMAGEHLQADFLAVNPVGRAPVLRDEDPASPVTIYGTLAIALYLADKCQRLMPATLAERALVYERCAFLATDLSPALAGQFMMSVIHPVPEAASFFEHSAHRMLAVLDGWLAEGPYVAGESLSIADALGYPAAAGSAARLEGGLEAYPNIRRWAAELGAMDAIARGMAASA